jgi:hypothetical protein
MPRRMLATSQEPFGWRIMTSARGMSPRSWDSGAVFVLLPGNHSARPSPSEFRRAHARVGRTGRGHALVGRAYGAARAVCHDAGMERPCLVIPGGSCTSSSLAGGRTRRPVVPYGSGRWTCLEVSVAGERPTRIRRRPKAPARTHRGWPSLALRRTKTSAMVTVVAWNSASLRKRSVADRCCNVSRETSQNCGATARRC